MKIRFKVSYRGESDYTYDGREYGVRSFASDDGHYNGDCYQREIEPFVGCLRIRYNHHEFPSPEAIAAFAAEHPGIVGARFADGGFDRVEYTSPRLTVWRERSKTLNAKWHDDEMAKFYPAIGGDL